MVKKGRLKGKKEKKEGNRMTKGIGPCWKEGISWKTKITEAEKRKRRRQR